MQSLFIIEAPGKRLVLQEILKKIGIDAKVQTTGGHLFGMPKELSPLGIDANFRPYNRLMLNVDTGRYIRDAVKECGGVYIATDADQEGDVIAWDVAELIKDLHPSPLRVRLTGMDTESVRQAVDAAVPVRKEDAVPGRTRAIVDRLIGGTLSHDGIRVGRIVTALLGIVSQEILPTAVLRLSAPAADGGRPWLAETDVKHPLTEKIAHSLAKVAFPVLDKKRVSKPYTAKPKHMGEILVRASEEFDISPGKAAESLQSLYEAGKMSYPRANSNGLSPTVAAKIADLVKNSGYHVQKENFAEKKETDVHDAPYPIGPVNLNRDHKVLGHVEGVRAMVARDLVKNGQAHVIEEAFGSIAKDHLLKLGYSQEIAEYVANLPWRRENGPRYPGQKGWPESEVVIRRADSVLLEAAIKKGLGRPSSWATHIDRFMKDQLVDEELHLTAKGKRWVAGSPALLLDPRVSAAIEKACETAPHSFMEHPDREPWEILAERIVKALPPALNEPLTANIKNEKPRPKVDPTAIYRETVGLDEVLEKSREHAFKLAPKLPMFDD